MDTKEVQIEGETFVALPVGNNSCVQPDVKCHFFNPLFICPLGPLGPGDSSARLCTPPYSGTHVIFLRREDFLMHRLKGEL